MLSAEHNAVIEHQLYDYWILVGRCAFPSARNRRGLWGAGSGSVPAERFFLNNGLSLVYTHSHLTSCCTLY